MLNSAMLMEQLRSTWLKIQTLVLTATAVVVVKGIAAVPALVNAKQPAASTNAHIGYLLQKK